MQWQLVSLHACNRPESLAVSLACNPVSCYCMHGARQPLGAARADGPLPHTMCSGVRWSVTLGHSCQGFFPPAHISVRSVATPLSPPSLWAGSRLCAIGTSTFYALVCGPVVCRPADAAGRQCKMSVEAKVERRRQRSRAPQPVVRRAMGYPH